MTEKATKKTVAISIKRQRPTLPRIIVATGFKLRFDKATGMLDVYLEASGQKGERVSLDPTMLRTNLDMLKRYAAGLAVEQDDAAQKDDIAVGEQIHFANIVHCSHVGDRSETIFGVFSMADWVEATRPADGSKSQEITSFDSLVAVSAPGVQKKLVLELVLLISQQGKE